MRSRVMLTATAALVIGSVLAVPAAIHADPPVARDAGVIIRWNEITERTLFENAQPIPTSLLFYGFSALAMYDAVVSIEGRFEPYHVDISSASGSPVAATATAAHDVLVNILPGQAAALDTTYRDYLATNFTRYSGSTISMRAWARASIGAYAAPPCQITTGSSVPGPKPTSSAP